MFYLGEKRTAGKAKDTLLEALQAAQDNFFALKALASCRGYDDSPTVRLDSCDGVGRGRIDLN